MDTTDRNDLVRTYDPRGWNDGQTFSGQAKFTPRRSGRCRRSTRHRIHVIITRRRSKTFEAHRRQSRHINHRRVEALNPNACGFIDANVPASSHGNTSGRSPRRRNQVLSREQITATTVELLDAGGESAPTMRTQTERLATGSGAIYYHVGNRDELLETATETAVTAGATVHGTAPNDLFDTYTGERHPVGAAVLDWSRAQVATMKPGPNAPALRRLIRDLKSTPTAPRTSTAGRRDCSIGTTRPTTSRSSAHRARLPLRERQPDPVRRGTGPQRPRLHRPARPPDGVVAWASERTRPPT
ncbi:TetR/AcrR family transcriptional regulator [Embleya scabrispora]|uniref:TetR/AcrR family transcriptional regulator n=1 Tax=Embleya scabrispora TaxID=159449 RepID=UPI001F39AA0D|nr:TetR/AcrR family transcriptional regulator [Embleya scabrispora]